MNMCMHACVLPMLHKYKVVACVSSRVLPRTSIAIKGEEEVQVMFHLSSEQGRETSFLLTLPSIQARKKSLQERLLSFFLSPLRRYLLVHASGVFLCLAVIFSGKRKEMSLRRVDPTQTPEERQQMLAGAFAAERRAGFRLSADHERVSEALTVSKPRVGLSFLCNLVISLLF